ncbi:hypothetical protein FQN54_003655 [Arachnomyces sp. PD_36]|nr:hypothetical protein FQN54_003655 [Arachnomyces sp. PD_36]
MFRRAIAAIPLLLGALVHDVYAAPGGCSGSCNIHDPALIQRESDGVYFRFSTGGGMAIASSSAIEGPWTDVGTVLAGGDNWAPDVSLVGDVYNLYYSVSSFGTQDSYIGLATSTDLETWTDMGNVGIASDGSSEYNAIDANLFQGGDGTSVTFGSYWGGLYQVAVAADGTTPSGDPLNLAADPNGIVIEGAYLFENEGYYYLFFSQGVCCTYDENMPAPGEEYRIKVCRADSPAGPFADQDGLACSEGGGTLVLGSYDNVYGPGGQGVYADPNLGAVLYYHYVDTNIGYADGQKLFGWNVLNWTDGWPVAV